MNQQAQQDTQSNPVAALIDARQLALTCQALEQERAALQARAEALQRQAQNAPEPSARDASLARLGQDRQSQLIQEARAWLRAIVSYSGETERLEAFEALAADPNTTPAQLQAWHERIEQEFRLLYPSEPRSRPAPSGAHEAPRFNLEAFRLTETHPETHPRA